MLSGKGVKWGTESLDTRFPLRPLLYAKYTVKLKYIKIIQYRDVLNQFFDFVLRSNNTIISLSIRPQIEQLKNDK